MSRTLSLAATAELPGSPRSHQEVAVALCRVCNEPSSNCLPLFQQLRIGGKCTTLAKVLIYCTGLAILEEEHFLPQHICPACMIKMQASLQFKQSVHRMDRLLRQRQLPAEDPLPEAGQSPESAEEEVSEEYILVLDEREEQQQHVELKVKKSAVEVEFSRDTDGQQLKYQTEEDEDLAKSWLQITQDADEAEAEAVEENLYEIVEEEPEEEQPKIASRKTQNPKLQCQICGKQLSTSNSFKYHMQLHGTATPYVCPICGEPFKTRNAYDGHVTLHDPNNPNRCTTCGKVYRQASSLRSHLLTHSGIKPFECTICGKRLSQRSGYKKHMLIHTGEKPHGCAICGRSFRYSSNLIAHKRSHSQEKPHECQVCRKRSFASTSELNRHMLVHSSERPFACRECGKSFKRQVSLNLHQQSHKMGRVEADEEAATDRPES